MREREVEQGNREREEEDLRVPGIGKTSSPRECTQASASCRRHSHIAVSARPSRFLASRQALTKDPSHAPPRTRTQGSLGLTGSRLTGSKVEGSMRGKSEC